MTEYEPENKGSYLMGIDFYKRKIVEIEDSVSNEMTDWEKLDAIERIEHYELLIYQNERRHAVFNEGGTFSDIHDIINGRGGVSTYDTARSKTTGTESNIPGQGAKQE